MPLFGDSVERSIYEDMKKARDVWQQECSALRAENMALIKEIVAVKRYELGLPPQGVSVTNPLDVLGPRTRAMIEEKCGGFADLRSKLTNWAILETKKAVGNDDTTDEVDTMIAHAIEQGDGA